MDLKNLFSKKNADANAEPKTIKDYLGLIVTLCLILIFLIIYFFLIRPTFKEQEVLIQDKYYKLQEIESMNNQISSLITKVEELELEREEKFKLFVSEKEVEELYQLISLSALRNNLKVNRLIRGEEEAIRESADSSGDVSGIPVDYYKIYVEYDIEGRFPDYLKLKSEIAELDKLIVFEKEEVSTTESRTVVASVKISLVRMPTR
ncbi:MAG: hypothetical protein CFH15_00008 [Alphaproteobacteria bacterium MarineAlpha5_Bin5]|nr:MAG: hypothetical protein CFH15_00008 [Alphaproteobacteria bacterium MarineAlpha5_Bin5]